MKATYERPHTITGVNIINTVIITHFQSQWTLIRGSCANISCCTAWITRPQLSLHKVLPLSSTAYIYNILKQGRLFSQFIWDLKRKQIILHVFSRSQLTHSWVTSIICSNNAWDGSKICQQCFWVLCLTTAHFTLCYYYDSTVHLRQMPTQSYSMTTSRARKKKCAYACICTRVC